MTRVRARYTPHPVPPAPEDDTPPLHDIEDNGRVAIFDPARCDQEACWIYADAEHTIDPREEV